MNIGGRSLQESEIRTYGVQLPHVILKPGELFIFDKPAMVYRKKLKSANALIALIK